MQGQTTAFDAAAARLLDVPRHGDPRSASSRDLQIVTKRLRYLLERSYGLSVSEAEETTQEVIVRVLELRLDPGEHPTEEIRNPGAYLIRLARNRAIDHVRRRARSDVELSDELQGILPSHDDEIAAMLDATVTSALVRAAVRAASEAGDHVTLRVISTWLDLADELGEPPVSREVAERAGVSHTTVNHALKRFRAYLRVA